MKTTSHGPASLLNAAHECQLWNGHTVDSRETPAAPGVMNSNEEKPQEREFSGSGAPFCIVFVQCLVQVTSVSWLGLLKSSKIEAVSTATTQNCTSLLKKIYEIAI